MNVKESTAEARKSTATATSSKQQASPTKRSVATKKTSPSLVNKSTTVTRRSPDLTKKPPPTTSAKSVSTIPAKGTAASPLSKASSSASSSKPASAIVRSKSSSSSSPPTKTSSLVKSTSTRKYKGKFNIAEIKMLRDCFKAMDSDNDGHVSRKEFRLALEKQTMIEREIGQGGSETRLDLRSIFSASFFDMVDKNKTEQITFKQLLRAMYPTASQDDLKHMIELAFPKPVEKPPSKPTLSPQQIEELTQIFSLYDKDGSNSISLDELRASSQVDLGISPQDFEHIFTGMDTDGDNQITLEEFLEAMSSIYTS